MPTIKEMQHFIELLKEENNSLREKIYAQTKLIETIGENALKNSAIANTELESLKARLAEKDRQFAKIEKAFDELQSHSSCNFSLAVCASIGKLSDAIKGE